MENLESSVWSVAEVQALIGVWSEDQIQRDLESSIRNEKVYQSISQRLQDAGVQRSAKRCREKIKKLKQGYRKLKDHNNRSVADRKTSKWYNILDAVLGHRPTNCRRTGTLDSATALLEAMVEEEHVQSNNDVSFIEHEAEGGSCSGESSTSIPTTSSSPALAAPNKTPVRRVKGKKKRDQFEDFLREMESVNRDQQERTHAQRERHFQLLLDDAVQARAEEAAIREKEAAIRKKEAAIREKEAAIREKEAAETASFNQAFVAIFGQLVQVLGGQGAPTPPPLD
uniref:myb/SANT-like DNA-binding domain-containing protein 2 n=1 Tax=Myxine glutinosa TaxID=7769 RepID=UPI00358F7A9A